jgi:hypothetical protein
VLEVVDDLDVGLVRVLFGFRVRQLHAGCRLHIM